jgi:hypothetical protein
LRLLCAANDVAIGISFVGWGPDVKVCLCCLYDFIEERVGDIPTAKYRQGKDEGFFPLRTKPRQHSPESLTDS